MTNSLLKDAYTDILFDLSVFANGTEIGVNMIDFSVWNEGKQVKNPYIIKGDDLVLHWDDDKEFNLNPSTNKAIQDEESNERLFFEWFYQEFSKKF